ncbi:beta-defensin 12-like [Microtus ochrogaster]|uniref:Beta-defensin n=1 Tax=Microtus ochrogaster TaxID=79684 RepID=A0ABM1UL30_MICOH|nr:beta-defensin 12-like [Microtus ochrogaster]
MAPSRAMFSFVCALFFSVALLPSGSRAGLEYSQSFPGGEFAVCETCWLGRGKCRTVCLESEKIAGRCKLNFFCCRERI